MRRALQATAAAALLGAACATSGESQHADQAQFTAAAEARAANPNRPVAWWPEVAQRGDDFYRSEDGRRMAESILSWQQDIGGWPLMNTTREPFTGDASRAGPWGMRAALIKATVNEIRFMARAARSTGEERYETSMLRGIEFILGAQYPTGGWPHSWPVRDDYTRHATYNDDMMPDLMMLLSEVASSPDFAIASEDMRARTKSAFDRGVDFVLKSQIRVDGELTAWAQQHDAVTYEPRPARAFEPVAISGGESASVLHMLMAIPDPSSGVVTAIEAGVAWYRKAQIDGLKLTQTADDRVVTPDPDARPIWARFYEIGSGRPVFVGRDGVVRYSMAEIEQERRGGYAWYNYSGTGVFAQYQAWKKAR
jgi:PelA/Pel-15E family pectate lyase